MHFTSERKKIVPLYIQTSTTGKMKVHSILKIYKVLFYNVSRGTGSHCISVLKCFIQRYNMQVKQPLVKISCQ